MMDDGGSARPSRVLLVEDHASFRQALALALGQERDLAVVAQAGSLSEARSVEEGADLAVVDLALPDGSGVDLIEELRRNNRGMSVLILSATLDDESIARAVDAGAAGIVDKLAGLDEIINEARRLRAGAAMPRQKEIADVLRTIAWHGRRQQDALPDADLTPQETELLRALADGLDNYGLAEKQGISVEEGRERVARILDKLGANSSLQAIVVAARRGVIDLP